MAAVAVFPVSVTGRAATQRDLADVLAGRGRRDGRADQAIVFAVVLMLGTLAFVAIS